MGKNYTIQLSDIDIGQLLDGLEIRAQSWERTAEYLRTESVADGEPFLIEECSNQKSLTTLLAITGRSSTKSVSRCRLSSEQRAMFTVICRWHPSENPSGPGRFIRIVIDGCDDAQDAAANACLYLIWDSQGMAEPLL